MEPVKNIKKEKKHLLRIKKMQKAIYTKIAPLDVSVHKSAEPIAPGNQKNLDYKPIKKGMIWAKIFGCAWFKIRGKIPENAKGKHIAIHINLGGEAAVYDQAEPVAAVTLIMSYIDRLQASYGKTIIEISDKFTDGKEIELYLDAGYNGYYNYPFGFGIFQYAYLCTVNDDLLDYYYDYVCLTSLLSVTTDKAKRGKLETSLDKSYSILNSSVSDAKKVLFPFLNDDEKNDDDLTFYAVGHSHLDLAWLWPMRETKRKAQRTFAHQINNAVRYPSYIYGASQAWQFEYIKNNYPGQFAKLQDMAKKGQLELQGGMYVEADTNLSSGESLIRQIHYGKTFFFENFNQNMRMCWLPDVFGYNGNLPQILKKSGLDYFMTIKLSWNEHNRFPYRSFVWKGIDDSNVLVHMSPAETYNSAGTPACTAHAAANYTEKDIAPKALLIYGVGDGGGGPGDAHIELVKRQENIKNSPSVVFSKAVDFFEKLNEYKDSLPVYDKELYLEKHQGTYTTQGISKKYNRKCEYALQTLESLCAYATQKGYEYPKDKLDKWWKEVLLYQFHDIIPGSSITRVYTESHMRYEQILSEIKDEKLKVLSFLKTDDTHDISVFNPTSFKREEFFKHKDKWFHVSVQPYAFAKAEPASAQYSNTGFSDDMLENAYVRLEFSKQGHIISAIDKTSNKEYAQENLNTLRLYRDKWLFYNAWDIDWKYHEKPSIRLKASSNETYTDGPALIRKSVYKHNKTKITQHVMLYPDSPVIYFTTECDFHETFKMLRADFDVNVKSPFVSCDIQLGTVKRSTEDITSEQKAQFEICAHKYVDLSQDTHGISLMNDCKYGHRVKNNRISLNLLRSPVYPDKTADRGKSSFTYALYLHQGELDISTLAHSYALNRPLEIFEGCTQNLSIAQTSDKNIVIETIKHSYANDGTILRLYNSSDKQKSCSLTTIFKYDSTIETDLTEKEIKDIDITDMTFSPFEIKTIKFS